MLGVGAHPDPPAPEATALARITASRGPSSTPPDRPYGPEQLGSCGAGTVTVQSLEQDRQLKDVMAWGRAASFVLTATCAAALSVEAVPAQEGADPPQTEMGESAVGDDAARRDEVASWAAHHRISIEAAERLYLFQDEGLELIEAARTQYPHTFAGGWFTDFEAGGNLLLAFTLAADDSARAVAEDASDPTRVRGVEARYSREYLEDLRHEARDLFDERQSIDGWFGMSIDEPLNALKFWVADAGSAIVRELQRRFEGEPIAFLESNPPTPGSIPPISVATCETHIVSCNPVRSGMQMENVNGQGPICTFAFAARRNVDNQAMIMSAGHCAHDAFHSGGAWVGPTWSFMNGGVADAKAIHVVSGWAHSNRQISHTGQQGYAITGRYLGTNLANATVCLTGAFSGPFNGSPRCGAVTDADWEGVRTNDNVAFNNQFVFQAGGFHADSGAGVYSGGFARGIWWGFTSTHSWASYLVHAQNATGVTVRIS